MRPHGRRPMRPGEYVFQSAARGEGVRARISLARRVKLCVSCRLPRVRSPSPARDPSGGHGQCRGRGRVAPFCDLVFFFRGLCLARSSPALVLPLASASEVRASLRSTSFGFGLPLEPFVIFPYITNRSVQSQADDQRQSSRGVCRDPQNASALSFLVTRAT